MQILNKYASDEYYHLKNLLTLQLEKLNDEESKTRRFLLEEINRSYIELIIDTLNNKRLQIQKRASQILHSDNENVLKSKGDVYLVETLSEFGEYKYSSETIEDISSEDILSDEQESYKKFEHQFGVPIVFPMRNGIENTESSKLKYFILNENVSFMFNDEFLEKCECKIKNMENSTNGLNTKKNIDL